MPIEIDVIAHYWYSDDGNLGCTSLALHKPFLQMASHDYIGDIQPQYHIKGLILRRGRVMYIQLSVTECAAQLQLVRLNMHMHEFHMTFITTIAGYIYKTLLVTLQGL